VKNGGKLREAPASAKAAGNSYPLLPTATTTVADSTPLLLEGLLHAPTPRSGSAGGPAFLSQPRTLSCHEPTYAENGA